MMTQSLAKSYVNKPGVYKFLQESGFDIASCFKKSVGGVANPDQCIKDKLNVIIVRKNTNNSVSTFKDIKNNKIIKISNYNNQIVKNLDFLLSIDFFPNRLLFASLSLLRLTDLCCNLFKSL